MVPSQFSEITIRVYTKVPEKQKAVQVAFRRRVQELKRSLELSLSDSRSLLEDGEAVDTVFSNSGSASPLARRSAFTTPTSQRIRDYHSLTPSVPPSLTPKRSETIPSDFSAKWRGKNRGESHGKRPRMMMDLDS